MSGYIPLDELLERPAVRILRMLRRFGWVEVGDLFVAIGAPDDHHEPERAALSQALCRAVRGGFVERMESRAFIATPGRPAGRDHNWYRITDAGRREIERRLAVDMRVATRRELREPGSVAA